MTNNIIETNGKKYKLTNVKNLIDCDKIDCACTICDYDFSERCDIPLDVCPDYHCLKLVAAQERMNLSELSFKVITCSSRMTKLHDILKSLGVVLPINYNNTVFVICDEGHFQFGGSFIHFDKFLQEEITFDQAIYLLNKCSNDIKESKLGKFIEYDIAPDGKFDSGRTYWADFNFEENENSIFAGWLWENPKNPNCKTWSMNRKGIKGSRMISNCNEWEYPIIPKKIRYWVKE